MNFWTTTLATILGVVLIWWAVTWAWRMIQKARLKSVGGELDPQAFEETMRKAQIIDLREKPEFDAGHILGARSLPATQLKQRMGELRKDMPVYLYDLTGAGSLGAAMKLKRNGFEKVYFLKDGYNNWSGKTKKKKSLA